MHPSLETDCRLPIRIADLKSVRNKSAYLNGEFMSVQRDHAHTSIDWAISAQINVGFVAFLGRLPRVGVMHRHRQQSMPRLDRDVSARLDRLFRTSKIKQTDIDGRVYEELANIPPFVALRAIDRFQTKVQTIGDEVRNVSAFLTTFLRQVRPPAA